MKKLMVAAAAAGLTCGALAAERVMPDIFRKGETILFIGDSVTHGGRAGDLNHYLGHGYQAEIAMRYLAYRPELDLQFANRGISGDSSSNVVARWRTDAIPFTPNEGGYNGPFPGMKGVKRIPDWLNIFVGFNDDWNIKYVPPADTEKNIRFMIEDARKANPNMKIVLCEPYSPTHATKESKAKVEVRREIVRRLAREYGVILVPFPELFDALLKEKPQSKWWIWDNCHPTYAAHMRMADFWLETVAACRDRSALDRFYSANAGKTVRRLPVDVLPENTFHGYGNAQFEESDDRTMTEGARQDLEQGTWNMVTFTLRSKPDLNDAITQERVKGYIERAHKLGVKVYMDTDPRIARHEFLRRWPEDAQGIVRFETAAADAEGKAACTMRFPSYGDHMSAGSKRPYDAIRGRVTGAWAYRADADGKVDPAGVRDVLAATACETLEPAAKQPRRFAFRATGLKPGERLCVQAEFELYSADVFSPHLLPYTRGLMERYKALGADGGMRDEWGFPPTGAAEFREHRAFWTSRHYAAAYAERTKGRKLADDFLLFALDLKGREAERRAAIDAYMRLNFERNAAIERHFYDTDKELFGRDTYVCKHPTWYPKIGWQEFMHNGLDWWAAPRDWAQSDESSPVPAVCGMTKKAGGANWLNEGYQRDSLLYAPTVWRYALAGGRMVYHPVFQPTERYRALYRGPQHTAYEYWVGRHTDILKDGALDAQCRVRLLNLVSDAPIDCPAAVIFGHARVVNWADPAYCDWGRALAYGIWKKGYGTDVYPSSELEGETFSVGSDGRLAVGRQRYDAVVCLHFSKEDAAALARVTGCRGTTTKIFTCDAPDVTGAVQVADPEGADVAAVLAEARSVRQTPIWSGALPKDEWADPDGWPAVLPAADGVLRLTDGTQARMKAVKSAGRGDPIEGELVFADGRAATKVAFAAEGIFAARLGADGTLEAVAGGAVRRVAGPGFTCELEKPEDIALVRRADGWHGVWQTKDASGGIPAALRPLAAQWTTLLRP